MGGTVCGDGDPIVAGTLVDGERTNFNLTALPTVNQQFTIPSYKIADICCVCGSWVLKTCNNRISATADGDDGEFEILI